MLFAGCEHCDLLCHAFLQVEEVSAELKELLAKAYAEKASMTDANLALKQELVSLKGQHQSAETKVRALQALLPATLGT